MIIPRFFLFNFFIFSLVSIHMTETWLSYITTQIRANPGVKLETILNKYGNKYTKKKQKRKNSSKKNKYKNKTTKKRNKKKNKKKKKKKN